MKFEPATLALVVVTVAVWVDQSAWWSRAIVTAALAVCVVVDVMRGRKARR